MMRVGKLYRARRSSWGHHESDILHVIALGDVVMLVDYNTSFWDITVLHGEKVVYMRFVKCKMDPGTFMGNFEYHFGPLLGKQ